MEGKKRLAIGVDIGATNLRVALGTQEGRILAKLIEPTNIRGGAEGVSLQIGMMIRKILGSEVSTKDLKGIGIGSTGPMDLKRGAVVKASNLPWDFIPLVEPLQEAFGIPVRLLNDCAAAVLGEKVFGSGIGTQNLLYITLSTGIGAGVFIDGRLIMGKDGNAHEVGHFTIDFEGRLLCGCGKRGHWEAYCSGRNIPRYVKYLIDEAKEFRAEERAGSLLLAEARSERLTTEGLFNLAKAGDSMALKIVERLGMLNAIGFADAINAYDPELITVGGPIALRNEELILPPIRKLVGNHTVNRVPEIELTRLGEDVGLYGAIALNFLED
ncbi:MAG: ROK family protein [Candidatus Bathyarchaeia archaeon]